MLMHETTVAQSLLAAISDEAAKHNAKPIGARISCGELWAINDEALCFAFEAIAKGTPCEGVKLDIEHKPIRGQCKKCDHSFEVELGNPLSHPGCPRCGSDDFELMPDGPLILEEIELQTD
jgi:hydrogenase nickel incorporation protein HypA/HybF